MQRYINKKIHFVEVTLLFKQVYEVLNYDNVASRQLCPWVYNINEVQHVSECHAVIIYSHTAER